MTYRERYREKLLSYLDSEVDANGSYQDWYDNLSDFRRYMREKYIRNAFGKNVLINRLVRNSDGDLLDHHVISYLAPLEFSRVGWNGVTMSPVEQIKELSQWFARGGGGGRFIYAPLPNKGVIYPDLICSDLSLLKSKTSPAPQWRKYIRDLLETGVEVVDVYPKFRSWAQMNGKCECLFSKGHHVSALGAKVVSGEVADYLRETGWNGVGELGLKQFEYRVGLNDARMEDCGRMFLNFGERNMAYVGNPDAQIAVFGDCNLQSHRLMGAGITANLAYDMQQNVHDAGRMLPFDNHREKDNVISLDRLQTLKRRYEVVIYVAFASASFTRTVVMGRREFLKHPTFQARKWANFNLT